jgi:hypothetical protein
MAKKNCVIVMLIVALILSCTKEEDQNSKAKGTLSIEIGLFLYVNEVDNNLKSTGSTENFKVIIYSSEGKEVLSFEKASEMPESIYLEAGQYFVAAFTDNNLPAAFDNPYYYGKSEIFTINPGMLSNVVVNCELANTMVTVVYSENVKETFVDFTSTISTSAGSLIFSKTETRAGYFKPRPLVISAVLTWEKPDGSTENKTLTGTIPNPQPKKHYEIHIDAVVSAGLTQFHIQLNEEPDPIEIISISEDETPPYSGDFKSGDLLITEIMYDPDSLPDADGEWFEVYNNTGLSVDLQKIVIRKGSTENHIINKQVILASRSYLVLSRTDLAVSGVYYSYNKSISLNNTGAVLSLNNYGTNGTDGSVICSVDYGSNSFPEATGASICLSPGVHEIAEAVLGSNWCISTSVYNTGDLGTPGKENDACFE